MFIVPLAISQLGLKIAGTLNWHQVLYGETTQIHSKWKDQDFKAT